MSGRDCLYFAPNVNEDLSSPRISIHASIGVHGSGRQCHVVVVDTGNGSRVQMKMNQDVLKTFRLINDDDSFVTGPVRVALTLKANDSALERGNGAGG